MVQHETGPEHACCACMCDYAYTVEAFMRACMQSCIFNMETYARRAGRQVAKERDTDNGSSNIYAKLRILHVLNAHVVLHSYILTCRMTTYAI